MQDDTTPRYGLYACTRCRESECGDFCGLDRPLWMPDLRDPAPRCDCCGAELQLIAPLVPDAVTASVSFV